MPTKQDEADEIRRVLEIHPEQLRRHIEMLRVIAAQRARSSHPSPPPLLDCSLTRATKLREPELFERVFGEAARTIDVTKYQEYLRLMPPKMFKRDQEYLRQLHGNGMSEPKINLAAPPAEWQSSVSLGERLLKSSINLEEDSRNTGRLEDCRNGPLGTLFDATTETEILNALRKPEVIRAIEEYGDSPGRNELLAFINDTPPQTLEPAHLSGHRDASVGLEQNHAAQTLPINPLLNAVLAVILVGAVIVAFPTIRKHVRLQALLPRSKPAPTLGFFVQSDSSGVFDSDASLEQKQLERQLPGNEFVHDERAMHEAALMNEFVEGFKNATECHGIVFYLKLGERPDFLVTIQVMGHDRQGFGATSVDETWDWTLLTGRRKNSSPVGSFSDAFGGVGTQSSAALTARDVCQTIWDDIDPNHFQTPGGRLK